MRALREPDNSESCKFISPKSLSFVISPWFTFVLSTWADLFRGMMVSFIIIQEPFYWRFSLDERSKMQGTVCLRFMGFPEVYLWLSFSLVVENSLFIFSAVFSGFVLSID